MIEDGEEQTSRAPGIATGTDVIALAVAAVLAVAIVAGFAVVAIPDPRVVPTPEPFEAGPEAAIPPGCAASRSPMETVYRMFDLLGSGQAVLSSCWSPGRAPPASELATYTTAGRPADLRVESVTQRFESGQLYARLQMRGTWRGDPPAAWANDASRVVTLRQQPNGAWTIDEVTPPEP